MLLLFGLHTNNNCHFLSSLFFFLFPFLRQTTQKCQRQRQISIIPNNIGGILNKKGGAEEEEEEEEG